MLCASDLAKDLISHGNIFRTPTPSNKRIEKLVAGLNKMNFDDRLNLLKHSLADKLVLPDHHVFHGFNRFCHIVVNTFNGLQILHMLVEFIKHAIKMAEKYAK